MSKATIERLVASYEDMERFVLSRFDGGWCKSSVSRDLKLGFSLKTKEEAADFVDEVLYKRHMKNAG